MSLINDALSKVERDRAAQRLAAYPGAPSNRGVNRHSTDKARTSRLVLINVAVLSALSAVAVVAFLRLRSPESNVTGASPTIAATRPLDTAPTSAPASSTMATTPAAPTTVAPDSPFTAPTAPVLTSEPPPANDYELAGMTAVGDNTLISVMRRSDQRSVWIPVGKSVGEITAVSYNALSDEAVIRVRGQLLTVGMRSGPIESTEPFEPSPDSAAQTAE